MKKFFEDGISQGVWSKDTKSETLEGYFKTYDKDNNGYLDLDELDAFIVFIAKTVTGKE